MINSSYIVLFTALPLFLSFFPLLEKINHRIKAAKPAAVIYFALSFIMLIFYAPAVFSGTEFSSIVGGWHEIVGINQTLDGFAWFGFLLMFTVSFFSMLYSFSENAYGSSFYFFFLVLHAGMAGMLLADDFFNLFVFLEITGICAYVMIAWKQKEKALFASFKYLMLSSLGISIFLLGVFIIYSSTGSLSFDVFAAYFKSENSRSLSAVFAVAALIAGIGVRTAFIPYTWLPDAHAYAPHPVSAVLSGVVIKISFIAVCRIIMLLDLFEARIFLLWMGSAIALIGVIRALSQTDFKVLLAWHSVSQMGYVFAGFGTGTVYGITGSIFHALSHALFKSLLFLSVSVVIIMTGERSIKKVKGTGKIFPLAALLFTAAALSIAGIPPFTGYVSKKLILAGMKSYPAAYWVLIAASAGTFASFTKLSLIFRGKLSEEIVSGKITVNKQPFYCGYAGMSILAVLCLLTGIFGRFVAEKTAFLITGEVNNFSGLNLWSNPAEYLKVFLTAAAGIVLYRLVMSRKGQKFQNFLKNIRLSFDTQLVLLLSGFMIISLCIYKL